MRWSNHDIKLRFATYDLTLPAFLLWVKTNDKFKGLNNSLNGLIMRTWDTDGVPRLCINSEVTTVISGDILCRTCCLDNGTRQWAAIMVIHMAINIWPMHWGILRVAIGCVICRSVWLGINLYPRLTDQMTWWCSNEWNNIYLFWVFKGLFVSFSDILVRIDLFVAIIILILPNMNRWQMDVIIATRWKKCEYCFY